MNEFNINAEKAKLKVQTILVVDDNHEVLLLTKRVLEKHGFSVLLANDVFAGLHMFNQESHKIDLLLTAVLMPGKTGMDLWEEISQANPRIKVVFMSGYPRDLLIDMRTKYSNIKCLRKPFMIEALLECLREVLTS